MRRWHTRTLSAMAFGLALSTAASAQQPLPPETPIAAPAAQPALAASAPVAADPYRAATPYNATVVSRPVPNPQYNRPNMTLPCDIPNQNLDALQPPPRDGAAGHFLRYTGKNNQCDSCNSGGCSSGLGWLKSKLGGKGGCDGNGSCITCQNTCDFIFGSSRSYFGESSREFFERPPAPDAYVHPHKANKHASTTSCIPQ